MIRYINEAEVEKILHMPETVELVEAALLGQRQQTVLFPHPVNAIQLDRRADRAGRDPENQHPALGVVGETAVVIGGARRGGPPRDVGARVQQRAHGAVGDPGDSVVHGATGWRFARKVVVLDSRRIDTLLAIPF